MRRNYKKGSRVPLLVALRAHFCRAAGFALAIAFSSALSTPSAHAATSGALYTFQGGGDGANPDASLIEVGGVLYGTTVFGGGAGTECGGRGCGTVFSLTSGGVHKVIYAFKGGTDGFFPYGGLIKVGNQLYGTTRNYDPYRDPYGGWKNRCQPRLTPWCNGAGTVFSITPSGVHKVLHVFTANRSWMEGGGNPYGNLLNLNGTLYGTTSHGGENIQDNASEPPDGFGTIFSITTGLPRVAKVIASMNGEQGTSADERSILNPKGGLIDVGGTLYGFGISGIFAVTPNGALSVVYNFGVGIDPGFYNGDMPGRALVDVNGILYGTMYAGEGSAANCCGAVFKLSPVTKKLTTLYSFKGGADGSNPVGGPIYLGDALYGVTTNGGDVGSAPSCGTVFSVTRAGVKKVLHSFNGTDGGYPQAGLINVKGTLYGTAYEGGQGGDCAGDGFGTVFWVKP